MRTGLARGVVALVLAAAVAVPVVEVVRRAGDDGARHSVFYGINQPEDAAALRRAAEDAGRAPTVENIFVKLDSTRFDKDSLLEIRARGMDPMVSLEPWSWRSTWGDSTLPAYTLASVHKGRHDAALLQIARTISRYDRLGYLRFAHEMNGWWYPWAESQNGNVPGDYTRAWRHVHRLFRSAGATHARVVWSVNAVSGSAREVPLERLYPGDDYVDLVRMTAYGHGPSAADSLDPTYRRLTGLTSRSVLITETGADGPARADWVASFGDYLAAYDRIRGFVWFNTTPDSTGASGDYRFNATPTSARAFARMLADLNLDEPGASPAPP